MAGTGDNPRRSSDRSGGAPRPLSAKRFAVAVAICLAILAVMLLVSPGVGSEKVSAGDAWRALFQAKPNPVHYAIAWKLRFPRAIKALLAGTTLALCGAVFQTLFRNPLATPYTTGVASGASLGALIAIKAGWTVTVAGISSLTIASFGGAWVVMALIFLLARSSARITGNTLLLAGMTIGIFCSGMMMFVTWLADVAQTHQTVRWLMGDLDTFGMMEVHVLLPVVAPAWLLLLVCSDALNQFESGVDVAASRGVNVRRLEITIVAAGCLGVAGVVSMCGPIGFVGLVIPHVTRLVFGRDHRLVLPASALIGGAFLIGCDFLTAWLPGWYGWITGHAAMTSQLPIGVMTALVGTPVFLALLCLKLK